MIATPEYPCPICGYVAGTPAGLSFHMQTAHPVETAIPDMRDSLSAMKDQIARLHDPRGVLPSIAPSDAEIAAYKARIAAMPPKELELGMPLTPENIWNHKLNRANDVQLWRSGRALLEAMLANLPFVDADVGVRAYENLPTIRRDLEQAFSVYFSEYQYGQSPYIQRYWLNQYRPLLPEAYRLALAAAKGILPWDVYQEAMEQSGLSSYWARMWEEQNYEFPDIGTALELLWRGAINWLTFYYWMRMKGYPDEVVMPLHALTEAIPPAADIITMVVREAFLPEMVVEAPGVFAEWMVKKGFSKEWSDRYWTAHFLPIPLGQAYDNLRRGYWTKEDFMFALHIADIHPRWREDIYNVAFNPPSIREMGYGYDVGAYTLEDIIKYRRWGGLSEEDAKKAGTAMVAYRTEAERNAVRTELMYAYGRGEIDKPSLEAQLTDLGTAPEAIPLWLRRADLYKERVTKEPAMPEQRMVSSSEALYAFRNGFRDEAWTRKVLSDLLWTEERINLAIQRVKWDIEAERVKEEVVELRKPSIALIHDYYKYGYITDDQIALFLRDLGYSDEDAVTMASIMAQEVYEELQPKRLSESDAEALYDMRLLGVSDNDALTKMRAIVAEEGVEGPTQALFGYYRSLKYSDGDSARLTLMTGLRFAFPDLKAMYGKGWIIPDILVSELMRLGLPKTRAAELAMTVVKMEQPARTTTERDLTKAEIIKGVKAEILTPVQGVGMLQDIGYDENEAWYILAINKVVGVGDPQGYWEMRRVTELAKKARGLPSIEIPDEVIRLEASIRITKQKLEKLKTDKAPEEAIGEVAVELAGLETELRQLIISKKLQ